MVQMIVVFIYGAFSKTFFSSFFRLFGKESILIFFIICFVFVRDVFKGEEVFSFRLVACFFQSFFVSYFIIYIFTKRDNLKKSSDIISTLYWTGFVASVLSFIFIFNSEADSFYRSIQLEDFEIYTFDGIRARAYGASENLVFTYSYVLGFFAGLTLLVVNKNIR